MALRVFLPQKIAHAADNGLDRFQRAGQLGSMISLNAFRGGAGDCVIGLIVVRTVALSQALGFGCRGIPNPGAYKPQDFANIL